MQKNYSVYLNSFHVYATLQFYALNYLVALKYMFVTWPQDFIS